VCQLAARVAWAWREGNRTRPLVTWLFGSIDRHAASHTNSLDQTGRCTAPTVRHPLSAQCECALQLTLSTVLHAGLCVMRFKVVWTDS